MIAALCDILGCGVDDLVTVTASRCPSTQSVVELAERAAKPNVVELNKAVRPRRARVLSDDD